MTTNKVYYTPPKQTAIDRSHAKRTVPMKVLCLGASRTGTLSLKTALERLGYVGCYHGFTCCWDNPPDWVMWNEAMDAKFEGKGTFGKDKWDSLLGDFQVLFSPCHSLRAVYP